MGTVKKWLIGVASATLIAAGLAWAQPISFSNLTGNEVVNAELGAGGTGFFVPVYVLRNGTGVQLVATGGTVNTIVPNNTSKLLATGAITTWNITFPQQPFDGQMLEVACPGGTSTVAMSLAGGPAGVAQVGTAFTACTAGGAAAVTAEWIYALSTNTWYRVQ